jgi:hypothetical protein
MPQMKDKLAKKTGSTFIFLLFNPTVEIPRYVREGQQKRRSAKTTLNVLLTLEINN